MKFQKAAREFEFQNPAGEFQNSKTHWRFLQRISKFKISKAAREFEFQKLLSSRGTCGPSSRAELRSSSSAQDSTLKISGVQSQGSQGLNSQNLSSRESCRRFLQRILKFKICERISKSCRILKFKSCRRILQRISKFKSCERILQRISKFKIRERISKFKSCRRILQRILKFQKLRENFKICSTPQDSTLKNLKTQLSKTSRLNSQKLREGRKIMKS